MPLLPFCFHHLMSSWSKQAEAAGVYVQLLCEEAGAGGGSGGEAGGEGGRVA